MNSGDIYDVCMSELFQEFIRIRPQWEEKKIKVKRHILNLENKYYNNEE